MSLASGKGQFAVLELPSMQNCSHLPQTHTAGWPAELAPTTAQYADDTHVACQLL